MSNAGVEAARKLVKKWAQHPDEDGKVFWTDARIESDQFWEFPDVREQIADIAAHTEAAVQEWKQAAYLNAKHAARVEEERDRIARMCEAQS